MSLPLTPDVLRSAYNYLVTTAPFNRWNLPDGDDVVFHVFASPAIAGEYRREGPTTHRIRVSRRVVGTTGTLMWIMAHEMIHLHEEHSGAVGRGQHSAAFRKWAAQVCKIHGFDVKMF
jgi:hypothetical protein